MNQQTLQKIYKNYQPDQYFRRYFEGIKLREDRRQFFQARDIKISVREGSVAVSRGQTIIICTMETRVEKVIYDNVEQNYGQKPLINLNVILSSFKGFSNRQSKSACSVEEFINSKINWGLLQGQLVVKETGNRYFAHTGEIQIRVISNDGALNETCLLGVELVVWCNRFSRIDSESGSLKQDKFMLQMPNFWFPSKYCEIRNQLLTDPTKSEEQTSSYQMILIGDILSQNVEENYFLVQQLSNRCEKIPENVLKSILALWKTDMSKLTFDVKDLRRRVNSEGSETKAIDLLISFH